MEGRAQRIVPHSYGREGAMIPSATCYLTSHADGCIIMGSTVARVTFFGSKLQSRKVWTLPTQSGLKGESACHREASRTLRLSRFWERRFVLMRPGQFAAGIERGARPEAAPKTQVIGQPVTPFYCETALELRSSHQHKAPFCRQGDDQSDAPTRTWQGCRVKVHA